MKNGDRVRVRCFIGTTKVLAEWAQGHKLQPYHLNLRQIGEGHVAHVGDGVVFVLHDGDTTLCAAYDPAELKVISKAERAADPGGGIRPDYYGGPDDPFEPLKIIEAWGLDFALGCVVKYVARAGKKTADPLEDLKKAHFYLGYRIARLEAAKGVSGVPGA
jgi:hypothetical protein